MTDVVCRPFQPVEVKEELEVLLRLHWEEVQKRFDDEVFEFNWPLIEKTYSSGIAEIIGAFADGRLVGYYAMAFIPSVHTKGVKSAQDMAWFVHKDYRHGRVGVDLLKMAEKVAMERGCRESSISVKMLKTDKPERILKALGYVVTDHRLTKQLVEG